MRRLRSVLALITVLAVAPLAAGCGSDDGSSKELLADAASATTDAGSARMSFRGTSEGTGLPQPLEIRGEGVVDNAKRVGRIEFDFTSLAASLPQGSGVEASDLRGEMIFDRFVFYIRFPILQRLLPGGQEWVRFDAEELGKQQGLDLGQLSQLGQADPSQALGYLRAVSGEVEEKGEEDVRGVATTRYAATVDLRKVPDLLPEDERKGAKESIDALIQQLGGESELPMEVWVDDDGLIRRQRFEFALPAAQGGGEASFRYDIEMYDFGVKVSAEPPPEESTADLTELLAGAATQQN